MLTMVALMAAAVQAQGEPVMRADDPKAFHAALRDMGYSPDTLDMDKSPSTTIAINGNKFWVILGGCDDKKQGCKTVMVGARFTDVKNPPLEWINKQNADYDLIKVYRTEEGELGYSVQAPAHDMTRANFRSLIDGLLSGEGSLADDARDSKLVK